MSADNWMHCPLCLAEHQRSMLEAERNLAARYGNISADEWIAARTELDRKKREDRLEETLREDYEIGMSTATPGKFTVSYGASCTKCGWSFEFEHEVADATARRKR